MGAGIAWIYRQSGVLNFAHGAIATLSVYAAYTVLDHGFPYWMAASVAILVGAVVGGAVQALLLRYLSGAGHTTLGIATLGVGLVIIGAVALTWGGTQRPLPFPLFGDVQLQFGSLIIQARDVVAIGAAIAVLVALFIVIERTRFGLAMRAISEGPVTAGLLGINVQRLRLVTWAVGGVLAAIAALFVTPANYLDPDFMTTFMISAFAAVVVGGLESVGGTFLGALFFGTLTMWLSYAITGKLQATAAFVTIVVVLAFRPHGIFGRRLRKVQEPVLSQAFTTGRRVNVVRRLPTGIRRHLGSVLVALVVLGLIAAPSVAPTSTVFALALTVATFMAVLSQNIVTGYTGQLSVGQNAFMLVGAYTSVLLATYYHLPFVVTLAAGALAATLVAAVAGVVVLRLSGIYLALATLSLGLAMPELAAFPAKITGGSLGKEVPVPELFGLQWAGNVPYWTTLIVSFAIGVIVAVAAGSGPGRSWKAVRDSETGAASVGLATGRVKLRAVMLGGLLAGVAGTMQTTLIGYLTTDDYTLWTSVYLLAGMMVGGSSTVVGAIIGAAFITLVPVLSSGLPSMLQIILGAGIIASIVAAPTGIAGLFGGDGDMEREALGPSPSADRPARLAARQ